MKRAILVSLAALAAGLTAANPVGADEMSRAAVGGVSPGSVEFVAFGDGPATGTHRTRRSRGPAAKPIEPSHADMHGATREDADKEYRKKYGF